MSLNRQIREKHHFHACSDCGHIWDHDPAPHDATKAEFDRMHRCELCGSNKNTDVACANPHQAQEFCTHGYITEDNGKRYYAPTAEECFLSMLLGAR